MVILRKKCHYEWNLGSPVKNFLSVSLIYLSESVRRGPILFGCERQKIYMNLHTLYLHYLSKELFKFKWFLLIWFFVSCES